jgi:hypothetical protein
MEQTTACILFVLLSSPAIRATLLLGLLHRNVHSVELNTYNLEVVLSIAHLYRRNLEMLRGLGANRRRVPQCRCCNRALSDATETWYMAWLLRLAEANG